MEGNLIIKEELGFIIFKGEWVYVNPKTIKGDKKEEGEYGSGKGSGRIDTSS